MLKANGSTQLFVRHWGGLFGEEKWEVCRGREWWKHYLLYCIVLYCIASRRSQVESASPESERGKIKKEELKN